MRRVAMVAIALVVWCWIKVTYGRLRNGTWNWMFYWRWVVPTLGLYTMNRWWKRQLGDPYIGDQEAVRRTLRGEP